MRVSRIAAASVAATSSLAAQYSTTQTPQELIESVLNAGPNATAYSGYSSQIYYNATAYGEFLNISTNYDKLEASAKLRLPPFAYDYAAGGAGLEKTVASNRAAFDKWNIVPHVMRTVFPKRNLTTTLFGKTVPAPVVMAPVGVQTLFHPEGKRATASVFGDLGLPFTLSTASSTGFADVAKANGNDSLRWYQLYWPSDDDLTRSYLRSAKENGYQVLVVTVDTWDLGWRTRDLDREFFPFINGVGVQIGLEDPCAHEKLGFNPLSPNATAEQKETAALYHVITTSRGLSPVWANLPKLRADWDGPIVLKGVQSAEDARAAVEHGIEGIIVSNHGGRQVDGAIGALDALYEVTNAVKGNLTIGFDGGIRSGADIYKALAIGADFVQVGRPVLWGLANGGAYGVDRVMRGLLADFDLTVGLSGCQHVQELNRSHLVAAH